MFLPLLCLGTILAPSCPASCQPSCSPSLSSGSVGEDWFHQFSCSTKAPTRSCATAPLLHHQSWVAGQGGRCQLSLGLHDHGHHAWQPASLWQTAGLAPKQSCHNQAGLVFRPAGFFAFSFIGATTRWSLNHFPTRRGGFCTPGTGGAFTASTNTVPVLSAGTAQEVGPLTSSPSWGQSSGGALWKAVYTPGDGQTSPAYSGQSVQCLYINHLLSVNKLVLSYLLLRLLPQVWI